MYINYAYSVQRIVPILTQTKKIIKLIKERQHSYIRSVTNSAERTGNVGWKIQAAYSTADFTKKSAVIYYLEIPDADFTSQTARCKNIAARRVESDAPRCTWVSGQHVCTLARLHTGDTDCMITVCRSYPPPAVCKNVHNQIVNLMHKKLSWCWQTHAMRLDVSQGHQTWYHSIC